MWLCEILFVVVLALGFVALVTRGPGRPSTSHTVPPLTTSPQSGGAGTKGRGLSRRPGGRGKGKRHWRRIREFRKRKKLNRWKKGESELSQRILVTRAPPQRHHIHRSPRRIAAPEAVLLLLLLPGVSAEQKAIFPAVIPWEVSILGFLVCLFLVSLLMASRGARKRKIMSDSEVGSAADSDHMEDLTSASDDDRSSSKFTYRCECGRSFTKQGPFTNHKMGCHRESFFPVSQGFTFFILFLHLGRRDPAPASGSPG